MASTLAIIYASVAALVFAARMLDHFARRESVFFDETLFEGLSSAIFLALLWPVQLTAKIIF